jgi:exodeoxyribonuclease V beta subunit
VELKNIYLRISGRDKIDTNYTKAINRQKELNQEDKLNALYVAFTRAKNNLFIIKKEQQSSFELLDLDIKNYGTLEPFKYETKQKKQQLKEVDFKEYFYGIQNNLLDTQTNLQNDIASLNFGTAFHYGLEMIEKFEHQYIDQAINIVQNRYGYLLEKYEIKEIKQRYNLLFENKMFLSLIKDAKLYKEQGIKYKNNIYYIDLLIKKENEYIIIDYKTGLNYHDKNVSQVKKYTKIISKLTSTKTKGYLCYILNDKIEFIEVS